MQVECYRIICCFSRFLYIDVTFWIATEYRFHLICFPIHFSHAPKSRAKTVFVVILRYLCCLMLSFRSQYLVFTRCSSPPEHSFEHTPICNYCHIVIIQCSHLRCYPVHTSTQYKCVFKTTPV